MPVKRYRFKKHKKAIQKEMLAVMEYHGETFASQIEKMIEKIIAQTFRFATSFGSTGASNLGSDQAGLSDATVHTRSEVKASKRGVEINVYATVVDPSGKAHLVWHILSQGRKPYVFPAGKTSPPIRRRKGHRTKRGNLKVSAFPGFMGDDTARWWPGLNLVNGMMRRLKNLRINSGCYQMLRCGNCVDRSFGR